MLADVCQCNVHALREIKVTVSLSLLLSPPLLVLDSNLQAVSLDHVQALCRAPLPAAVLVHPVPSAGLHQIYDLLNYLAISLQVSVACSMSSGGILACLYRIWSGPDV